MKQIALTGLMAAMVAVVLYGCGGGTDAEGDGGTVDAGTDTADLRAQLEANKAKWTSAGIGNYSYQVTVGCFCPQFWENNPVLVTVENDTTVSVISEKTGEDASKYYAGYDTVESLFETIAKELDFAEGHSKSASSGDILVLQFDPTYGFPTDYHFDLEQAADEQIQITVEGFKIGNSTSR
jgi:hypothetical protein